MFQKSAVVHIHGGDHLFAGDGPVGSSFVVFRYHNGGCDEARQGRTRDRAISLDERRCRSNEERGASASASRLAISFAMWSGKAVA
jgi:hypothetical protein